MEYLWETRNPDAAAVVRLTDELGVSAMTARLLVNRGVTEPDLAWKFLNPQLSDLHNPFLMKGMTETVGRLWRALEKREKILIYGDYDVDGITSTVVLRRALEMLGGRVDYHIPKRLEDGYGLKKEVFDRASSEGCSLVVSVDNGIRDLETCAYAADLGVDLIVTDHHLPGDQLPPALVILNPRQPGCGYPDKDLAAVGVVLKIVQALFEERGRAEVLPHFLKVVAIGTVADMVPLHGENRVIVKLGLSALSEPRNIGLRALLNGSGVGPTVDHYDVGFKLAPRINAFTRMGGGGEIVDLFSLDDPFKAETFVEQMNQKNRERRNEEDKILSEIDEMAAIEPERFQKNFLVVWGEDWHRGVIGNVAARVAQKFHRPTLVVSTGGRRSQGSGRSIPDFHLLEALDHCSQYFDRYGGHAQAVGCNLKEEYAGGPGLEELSKALDDFVASTIAPEILTPKLFIDSVLNIQSVGLDLCREVEQLAPFGIGNPVPTFSSRRVAVAEGPWILKDRHLKLRARANGTPVDVIWWRRAEIMSQLSQGQNIDLVYTIGRDSFRGEERILLTVKDLRA